MNDYVFTDRDISKFEKIFNREVELSKQEKDQNADLCPPVNQK
jgi:hypothetical protein